MAVLQRAAEVPLTPEEITEATLYLETHGCCVASLQRTMRIGWSRAADLIENIKGREALPAVARNRLHFNKVHGL